MSNSYKEPIDLTLPLSKVCALRGGIPTIVKRYRIPNTTHVAEIVMFSVHNATHIDLPWGIEWDDQDDVPMLGRERRVGKILLNS